MEVKVKLHVSCEEFFEVLEEALKEDIRLHAKNKKAEAKEGVTYIKTLRKGKASADYKIRVTKLKAPHEYESEMIFDAGTIHSNYVVTPIEGGCEVVFKEEREHYKETTFDKIKMSFKKNKARKQILSIEKHIDLKKEEQKLEEKE